MNAVFVKFFFTIHNRVTFSSLSFFSFFFFLLSFLRLRIVSVLFERTKKSKRRERFGPRAGKEERKVRG